MIAGETIASGLALKQRTGDVVNELWSEADRQHGIVHRLCNILAKLPKRPELNERIKKAYWRHSMRRRRGRRSTAPARPLVAELEHELSQRRLPGGGSASALRAPEISASSAAEVPLVEPTRALTRRGPPPNKSDWPVSGETSCLSLCWAVLDVFIAAARGLGLSESEYHQVVQLNIACADKPTSCVRKP
jgi:hypothetical protein